MELLERVSRSLGRWRRTDRIHGKPSNFNTEKDEIHTRNSTKQPTNTQYHTQTDTQSCVPHMQTPHIARERTCKQSATRDVLCIIQQQNTRRCCFFQSFGHVVLLIVDMQYTLVNSLTQFSQSVACSHMYAVSMCVCISSKRYITMLTFDCAIEIYRTRIEVLRSAFQR